MTSDPARAEPNAGKAAAVAFPVIALIILILFGISYTITFLLGLPQSLSLPTLVRVIGGGTVLLVGLAVMGWLFRYRGPATVIVSTYITFTKIFRRTSISEMSGRTEPLMVGGPQKYVRHPLYAGVVVMVLGWAIFTSITFIFVAALVVFLWFRLLLIPFEERELNALFGEEYKRYSETTPTMIPFTARKKHQSAIDSQATES